MIIRFSLSVPKARPSSGLVETVRFVRPYKYYSGLEAFARRVVLPSAERLFNDIEVATIKYPRLA